MRSLPHSRDTDAAADTSGVAYAIPTGADTPFFPATQVKVYVSALAFVGFGPDDSPPTAAATNTVYQEGATEVVYTWQHFADAEIDFLYVYAASGTVTVRVSFFG
jgi:D-alanyl-D-alanine carboxypeptidase